MRTRTMAGAVAALLIVLLTAAVQAQHLQIDLSSEEFRARQAKVFEQITPPR